MEKLLVIVDMQNDFVTGSLANPDAEKIVPGIIELIKNWDGDIAITMDIHDRNYPDTQEGKRLPIEHCICGTEGFKLVKDIQSALEAFDKLPDSNFDSFCKETFGSDQLGYHVEDLKYDEIYFCGTCTDICVISNAIICKSFDPEARIIVLKDLCAGTTPENHENALKAMAQCQIDIKEFEVCEKVSEEICDDFKANIKDEELDNVTSIAPEETSEEDKELDESASKAKDSIDKLFDTITEAVKKSSNMPKPEPKKKPFKIGFWGYLTIAAVVKGVIEVSRAVADSKRPKR